MSTVYANSNAPPGTPINPSTQLRLFQPFKQRSLTTHNHIGVPPMCMYSAINGHMNDFHIMHYGSLALKGPGLIIIEATGVVPEGRITPHCCGLWEDSQISGLKRVTDMIKSQGSVPGIQLGHAGVKASTSPPSKGDYVVPGEEGGWQVVGPTDEPFASHYAKPHVLTVQEIKAIVQSFKDAAVRAVKAGIELLEIHAAHGYLISRFYAASTNTRTDEYGGSFEKRIRFLLEIVREVRKVWHKPLWVRISCSDYTNPDPMGASPQGWDIYQSIALAKELKKLGVDTIDCSSGGIVSKVKYPTTPMFQVQFAEAIRREAGISTAAVGSIRNGNDAEEILQTGKADFILVGRAYLRNSAWTIDAAHELGVNEVSWPHQYAWAVQKARRRNKSKM